MAQRIGHRIIDGIETQRCWSCGRWLPLDKFARNRTAWDNCQKRCKECDKQVYAKKREHILQQKKQYHIEHQAERCEKSRRYRQEHPEIMRRYMQIHHDRLKVLNKEWRSQNREILRAIGAKRRAIEKEASGAKYTTVAHISARWEYYGWRCYLCGRPAEATDHVIPLAKGGSHFPANLRPICTSCNSTKKDRWPIEIPASHVSYEGGTTERIS